MFITPHGGDVTTIIGWTVGGTSVDYGGSYWQAQSGNRSIDLAGMGDGSLSQTFSTTAGKAYQVSFWIARNPDNGVNPRTGFVDVGRPAMKLTFSNGATTATAMGWTQEFLNFTATGPTTTVTFASDPATSQTYFGLALDNIAVNAVPEPTSWALMVGGLGLVGAALRRRGPVYRGA